MHALSEHTDAHSLIESIDEQFTSVVQDRALSDNLLSELGKKPYSVLFLDCNLPSAGSASQLLKKINQEFDNLITILISDDPQANDTQISL